MSVVDNLSKKPLQLALGLALVVGAVYYFGRRAVADVVDAGSGLVTGNNAITQSARTTAYQGAGVAGTVGAAVDNASGGVLSRFGEWLGGTVYDWTHPSEGAGFGSPSARSTPTLDSNLQEITVTARPLPMPGSIGGRSIV